MHLFPVIDLLVRGTFFVRELADQFGCLAELFKLRPLEVVWAQGQARGRLDNWFLRAVQLDARVKECAAAELAARDGDLAVFAVTHEYGVLDRSEYKGAVLAAVNRHLRRVVEDQHDAILQVVDLEHAAFEVTRLLDECLSLLLLEDQVRAFALLFLGRGGWLRSFLLLGGLRLWHLCLHSRHLLDLAELLVGFGFQHGLILKLAHVRFADNFLVIVLFGLVAAAQVSHIID